MGKHFDIGYFKKPIKVRGKVAKERTVLNKINKALEMLRNINNVAIL